MDDVLKLTPSEWVKITGIRILDPDGWDRKNWEESWGTPITEDDFIDRVMFCTVDFHTVEEYNLAKKKYEDSFQHRKSRQDSHP